MPYWRGEFLPGKVNSAASGREGPLGGKAKIRWNTGGISRIFNKVNSAASGREGALGYKVNSTTGGREGPLGGAVWLKLDRQDGFRGYEYRF